jgi:hypothetical protein
MLRPTERWAGGFVVDFSDPTKLQLAVTTTTAGATWQGGFLRDPDGRLVVTQ